MRTHLHPPRRLARLLIEALLVLAFLIQPVFVAAGELHALSHGSDVAHVQSDDTDTPAPEKTPHLLLHFAHCCGHAQTALLDLPMQLNASLDAAILHAVEPALPLQRPLQDTLRPPIVA